MVIKIPRDYDKIVNFHNEVIKSLKTQKARGDQKYEDQSEDIKRILEIPSNRFLDWAQSLQNFMDTTMTSKLNDYSLIQQYEKFIKELVMFQTNMGWLVEKINDVNTDYDVLTNVVLKLENQITMMKSKEAPLQETIGELQDENRSLNTELKDREEEIESMKLLVSKLKNKIWKVELENHNTSVLEKVKTSEELVAQMEKAQIQPTNNMTRNVSPPIDTGVNTLSRSETREDEPSPYFNQEGVESLTDVYEEEVEETPAPEPTPKPEPELALEEKYEKESLPSETRQENLTNQLFQEKTPFPKEPERKKLVTKETAPNHKIKPLIFNPDFYDVDFEDQNEYMVLASEQNEFVEMIESIKKNAKLNSHPISTHKITKVLFHLIEQVKIPKTQIKILLAEACDVYLELKKHQQTIHKITPARFLAGLILCLKKYDNETFERVFELHLSQHVSRILGNQLNPRDLVDKWEMIDVILTERGSKVKYYGSTLDNRLAYSKYALDQRMPYAKVLKDFKDKYG